MSQWIMESDTVSSAAPFIVAILTGVVANLIWSWMNRSVSITRAFLLFLATGTAVVLIVFLVPAVNVQLPLWVLVLLVVALSLTLVCTYAVIAHSPFVIVRHGMVGFMRRCIQLEQSAQRERLVVHRHIPTYLRRTVISQPDHVGARRSWDTAHGEEYRDLVNERHRVIHDLLEKSSVSTREIYEREAIERFVKSGLTYTGQDPTPVIERCQRLEELLRHIRDYKPDRYDIKILSSSLYFPFLICDDQLVIDVGRQTGKRFKGPLGGLYSNKRQIVQEYRSFFDSLWGSIHRPEDADRKQIQQWLESLIASLQNHGKRRTVRTARRPK